MIVLRSARLAVYVGLIFLSAVIGFAQTVTRGPYLQSIGQTQAVVRWRTDVPSDTRLSLGSSPGVVATNIDRAESTTEHEVLVTGLQPGTRYYYSVGTTTQQLVGGDSSHFFQTVPTTTQPTRIWVIGDSGTSDEWAAAVRDSFRLFSADRPADLWLMLGDNAYVIGTDTEYQTAVFDMYPELLRNTVLWPTFGNHDAVSADSATQTGVYYDIFTLPKNGEAGGVPSGTEAYYSFNYGNIHFICLDASESDRSPAGPMLTWLKQDLAATTQDWIIAFWHQPPYSKGSHDSDVESDMVQMRTNALPILEAQGVDLVLTGHSHSYERSYLIDGHYGLSSTFLPSMKRDGGDGRVDGTGAYQKVKYVRYPRGGTVYVVNGSSAEVASGPFNHPAMFTWNGEDVGSLILDISGDRLDATFLESYGRIRDRFTIIKVVDTAPPIIVSASAAGVETEVVLVYSEAVEAASATLAANYAIDNSVAVFKASLAEDARTVTLTTSALSSGVTYTVTVNNVRDLTGNAILANSQKQFALSAKRTRSFQDGVSPTASYAGTRDTYMSESSPNSNYGAAASLQVDGDYYNDYDLSSLIKWDLSSVAAGSRVESATVTFNVTNRSYDTYGIYEVKRDWSETGATWNVSVGGTPWQVPGANGTNDRGSIALGNISATAIGSYSIPLNASGLAVVQSWIDSPANNFGILIVNSAVGDGLTLDSRQTSTAANRPKLTIVSWDPEVPFAPTTLGATAMGSSQINLTWTDNATNEVGFKLERSLDGVNFSELATLGANASSYNDIGLPSATTFYYRVSAYNGAGNSAQSNIASATTGQVVPSAPSCSLTVTPTSGTAPLGVTATGSCTDADNNITSTVLDWGDGATQSGASGSHTYSSAGSYTVWVTATDATSLTGTATVMVTVSAPASAPTCSLTVTPTSGTAPLGVMATGSCTDADNNITSTVLDWGDGATQSGASGSHTYNSAGSYTVRVTATDATSLTGTATVTVTVSAPPSVPSGLIATPVSSTRIDLAWADNSNNESGFKIERSQDGASFTQIATVGPNVSSYANTGLSPAMTYYYRVRAFNTSGDSGYSNVASATTLQGIPAAPSSLTLTAVSSSQINLVWKDNSTNEEGFKIERSTDGTNFIQIATAGANVVTYADTGGLAASTRYFYWVRAYNVAGNSAYSNKPKTTTLRLAAPTNLSATAVSSSQINLSWTDNNANEDGFTIQRLIGGTYTTIATVGANVTSYSHTGLTPNTKYTYRVSTFSATSTSANSSTASATTLP